MKSSQRFSGNLSSRSHQFNGLIVNGNAHFGNGNQRRGKSRPLARWSTEDYAGINRMGEDEASRSAMTEDLSWERFGDRESRLKNRAQGTCEWLFQAPEYRHWLRARGILLVRGNPGSGKSTLIKFAARSEANQDTSHIVLRFYFYRMGVALQESMEGFLRSLLLQLVEQDSTSRLSFHDFCRKRMMGETAERRKSGGLKWHATELQTMFETLVLDGLVGRQISIFVDAVDECLDQERGRLISFLHRIRGSDEERSDRPKTFLTCRLYPVENFVVDFNIRIEERNQLDIQNYVEQELRITEEKESDVIQFKNSLFSQTRGLFLWAVLVVKRVHEMNEKGNPLEYIGSQIFNCPTKLNGLYKALLESLRDEELPEAGKLFRWIRFSCRPLLLEEIRVAMFCYFDGLPVSANEFGDRKILVVPTSDQQMVKRILHLGKGLIEVTDTKSTQNRALVRFHHETVKDFMDTCGLEYLNSRLKAREGLGNTADFHLANTCISYLSSEDIFAASCGESKDSLSGFLFLNYSATHWLDHAVQAESKGFGSLVDLPSPRAFQTWLRVCQVLEIENREDWQEETTLMHVAAEHGLISMAEKLMGFPSKLDAIGIFRSPVSTAMALALEYLLLQILFVIMCVSGNAVLSTARLSGKVLRKKSSHIISTLLETWLQVILSLKCSKDQKALIRKLDGWGRSAMHRAAAHGQLEMVKFLYCHKAELRSTDIEGETPMFAASYGGNLEIVKFLHAHGAAADVHVPDINCWTPIFAASYNNHPRVVEFLHAHGANIHTPDNKHQTPIYTASYNGHLEVVKFLYTHGANIHTPNNSLWAPIFAASCNGHLGVVEFLHAHGANIHIPDNDHRTPISTASYKGHLEVVEFLYAHGADIHTPDANRWTPLFSASSSGHLDMVEFLVAHGAHIQTLDKNHWTPIFAASRNGHLDVVKFLHNCGADIHTPNENCMTPIFPALYNGHLEVIEYLYEHGADIHTPGNNHWTPIHTASYNNHLRVVKFLHAHGANIHISDNDHRTPIFTASYKGHFEVVEFLCSHGADIHTPDISHWTPLNAASRNGHLEVIKLLYAHGAATDIHNCASGGATPVFAAADSGHLEVLEFLYEHGADSDIHQRTNDGLSPIYIASSNGHLSVVKFLCAHVAGADIHQATNTGWTPLTAASASGHLDVVKFLDECGDSTAVQKRITDALVAIRKASINGHLDVVRFLCEKGPAADVHQVTNNGWTLLATASASGHLDVVRFLYKHGPDTNIHRRTNDGLSPIYIASREGHLDVVKFLYERGHTSGPDIHQATNTGWTPLAAASASGHLDVVRFLYEHGPDTNIHRRTNDGLSPIYIASREGHLDVVKFLYEHVHTSGVSIHQATNAGWTPLAAASVSGYVHVVKFLCEHGADAEINQAAVNGKTPLSAASGLGHLEVVELLLEHGANIETEDGCGRTPLSLASARGHLNILHKLFSCGALVNGKDRYGSSPLFLAVRNGHDLVVDWFLSMPGISITLRDGFGHTPLWWATRCGKTKISRSLIQFSQVRGMEVCESDLDVEPSSMPADEATICDACTRFVCSSVAYHCPTCYDNDFDICEECFEMGARCLNESHEMVLQQPSA